MFILKLLGCFFVKVTARTLGGIPITGLDYYHVEEVFVYWAIADGPRTDKHSAINV